MEDIAELEMNPLRATCHRSIEPCCSKRTAFLLTGLSEASL
jgi:hypothetical protein